MAIVSAILLSNFLRSNIDYPQTRKVDHTDTYHGKQIADPYQWLEQPISVPEVRSWVDAQNEVTFDYLKQIPGRDFLRNELLRRANFVKQSVPIVRGNRQFFELNDGLQNQSVLMKRNGEKGRASILIDPNKFSTDGTVALNGIDFSKDGKRVVFAKSESGSDWRDWYVMDVDSEKVIDGPIKWSKFADAQFDHDGKGFYYLRYPEPTGGALTSANQGGVVAYHRIGQPQSADQVKFSIPKSPDTFVAGQLGSDRDCVVYYSQPSDSINNNIAIQPNGESKPRWLFTGERAAISLVDIYKDMAYFITDEKAPRHKVIAVNIKGSPKVNVVVPESSDAILSASIVGGKLYVHRMKDARSLVEEWSIDGKTHRTVDLPGMGTVAGFASDPEERYTYYQYEDMGTPKSIYRFDCQTRKSSLAWQPKMAVKPSEYVSKQVFYKSKDGTRVPMFIAHRKGMKLNGKNATLLYGYGGFGSSQQPWFSTSRTAWMDQGGVFVLACIRGGGEYGRAWHEAAIKTNRQKAYDDFIAAGEALIKLGYASKQTLAINGGSNGGLLVGAVTNQRPDLFAVAIPEVGVMDLLKFNQFTIGKAWESDYGSPQNKREFESLLKISPYHNLAKKDYPAVLVLTADSDDRVVPAHSFKYAARLQELNTSQKPTLIRVETSAGHGSGKPLTKTLEELADIYAFTLFNMGLKVKE